MVSEYSTLVQFQSGTRNFELFTQTLLQLISTITQTIIKLLLKLINNPLPSPHLYITIVIKFDNFFPSSTNKHSP